MRTLFAGLALAATLFGGIAIAQTTQVPIGPSAAQRVTPQLVPRVTAVCAQSDCDGDGANSRARGGTDCDDNDRDAYPGHAEVADTRGHDEDCDPTTFGFMDQDGDTFVTDTAHNTNTRTGRVYRGNDCNDHDARIRPNAQELPNRLDDDCNGYVDDLAGIWWNPPPS